MRIAREAVRIANWVGLIGLALMVIGTGAGVYRILNDIPPTGMLSLTGIVGFVLFLIAYVVYLVKGA